MVLCVHFVQDWLSTDSRQASHLGANRLLLYRRVPNTGQELRLATGSAHLQRTSAGAVGRNFCQLRLGVIASMEAGNSRRDNCS